MISSISNTNHGATGELLARRTDRRRKIIIGLVFGVGLASGIAVGLHVAEYGFAGPWPLELSIGIAILYLLAMAVGSVALSAVTDEVERARCYKAVAFAGAGYFIAYPVWFLLWKGGVAIEPIHWVLFIGFWLLLALGTLFYRFR